MRLVLNRQVEVAQWVAGQIPHVRDARAFGACAGIGIEDSAGRLVGGAIFNEYRPDYGTIEISFAVTTQRALTKSLIAGIMAYPYSQLQCERVTAITPRRSASARRFLETFGFKREGLLRRGFGNDDAVIFGLLKSEWVKSRWARPREARHGQERTADPYGP